MAATLTPSNLIVIADAESVTGWTNDSFSLEPDIKVEGGNSVSCTQTNNGANTMHYAGGPWNLDNKMVRLYWNCAYVSYFASTNPVKITISDGSSTTQFTYFATAGEYTGGWIDLTFQVNTTRFPGINLNAVTEVGIAVTTAAKPRNVPANVWFDHWRAVDGVVIQPSGAATTNYTEAAAADAVYPSASGTGRLGVLQESGGVIFCSGSINVAGDFDSQNETLVYPAAYAGNDVNVWSVSDFATDAVINGLVLKAESNSLGTGADVNLSFPSNSISITNSSFINMGYGGATVTGGGALPQFVHESGDPLGIFNDADGVIEITIPGTAQPGDLAIVMVAGRNVTEAVGPPTNWATNGGADTGWTRHDQRLFDSAGSFLGDVFWALFTKTLTAGDIATGWVGFTATPNELGASDYFPKFLIYRDAQLTDWYAWDTTTPGVAHAGYKTFPNAEPLPTSTLGVALGFNIYSFASPNVTKWLVDKSDGTASPHSGSWFQDQLRVNSFEINGDSTAFDFGFSPADNTTADTLTDGAHLYVLRLSYSSLSPTKGLRFIPQIQGASPVTFEGNSFANCNTSIFNFNFSTCTFSACDTITLDTNNPTMTQCQVLNHTNTGVLCASLDQLDDCTFRSPGTGHAIDLGTISASQSMTWNSQAFDYAATDGSTGNETVLVNVAAGQTLTINNNGGGLTIMNTGSGSVNVISGAVTVRITVIANDTGSPLQGARVYLKRVSNGTEVLTGVTNVSGVVENTAYTYVGDEAVEGWARKSSNSPLYKTSPIAGTITSTGFQTSAIMIRDDK